MKVSSVVYKQNIVKCTTSAFGEESFRMLKIIQRFGKYCSCHLQGIRRGSSPKDEVYIELQPRKLSDEVLFVSGERDRRRTKLTEMRPLPLINLYIFFGGGVIFCARSMYPSFINHLSVVVFSRVHH
jgi:hypothetical protein